MDFFFNLKSQDITKAAVNKGNYSIFPRDLETCVSPKESPGIPSLYAEAGPDPRNVLAVNADDIGVCGCACVC